MEISNFDKKCLHLAIKQAEPTFKVGNYPVGAVLAIEDKVLAKSGNEGKKRNSLVYHAENYLIIKNGQELYKAFIDNNIITLYSTLEPCLMCLGSAVMNKVNRIIYILKDPYAGACDLDELSMGVRYKESFPEIIQSQISDKPKKLILQFLEKELTSGNIVWAKKMLKLLGDA